MGRGSFLFRCARLLAILVVGVFSTQSGMAGTPVSLADPKVPLQQAWTHQRFGGATDYERVELNDVAAIRAIGRDSASGLYREVPYRVEEHPWLEWTWRVDRLQGSADIRLRDREDFAAAIFLIFGRPSLFNRDVPTLAYVWTSGRLPKGAVIDSPHHPGSVRDIVLRSGGDRLGEWLRERRNVVEDFRKAFGREPPPVVEVLALFTDNDQTREPVEAYYGAIMALSD